MTLMRSIKINIGGQATLVVVFVLGMASLVLALGFSASGVGQVQVAENTLSAKKAFYAAQAGVEDIMVRLKQDPNLGLVGYTSNTVVLGESSYIATVSAPVTGQREVQVLGRMGDFVKQISVTLASSSSQTSFVSAVQAGNGGFELEQNSTVTCKSPCSEGNVYSNGDVRGVKKSPASSASRVTGSVWASGNITKLGASDTGVWVEKTASAAGLLYCRVDGNQYSTATGPDSNCPLASGKTFTHLNQAPTALPLPGFDQDYWRLQATNSAIGGGTFTGDCVVLSGKASDCTGGTGKLGPKKITGSLTLPSNTGMTITGPVWVVGDINIASNNTVILDPSFVNAGTVAMTDGELVSESNVTYTQNGAAVIMLTSTKNDGLNCADPAVSVSSNTNNVVIYALNGCVDVAANSQFHGAVVGQKVHVSNNSIVEYDPALGQAVFGAASVGGWAVTDWREI